MRTTNQSVVDGSIDMPARSTTRSPERVVARVAVAVRHFIPERWLIDLLVLALAGLLVGAASLYGLAAVSTWMPTPTPPGADRSVRDGHDAGTGVLGGWADVRCCDEIQ